MKTKGGHNERVSKKLLKCPFFYATSVRGRSPLDADIKACTTFKNHAHLLL